MEPHESVLRFLGYPHFLFINTYIFMYCHQCWCSYLYCSVLLQMYVFSLFRVEKLLSTEVVVTGDTIQLISKTFWRGPSTPVPLPCLRQWRWVWRNSGMKFMVGETGEIPIKNLPKPCLVHYETHMEWPRREFGIPAVGVERLTACATKPPFFSRPINYLKMGNRVLVIVWENMKDVNNEGDRFQRKKNNPKHSTILNRRLANISQVISVILLQNAKTFSCCIDLSRGGGSKSNT